MISNKKSGHSKPIRDAYLLAHQTVLLSDFHAIPGKNVAKWPRSWGVCSWGGGAWILGVQLFIWTGGDGILSNALRQNVTCEQEETPATGGNL